MRLAVLDENTRHGMVIGWAEYDTEALEITRRYWADLDEIMPGVPRVQSAKLAYDPDIHTMDEVDAVNAAGRAWAP